MRKELVVIQPTSQVGSSIWPNVRGNLAQPNEATILECIGQARVQDTTFFNDLDARSNYRNRIAGIQVACLHTEIKQYPGLLEQLLADRGITLAPNTDPLQAELNSLVQLTSYRGMLPEMQAYQYSRRGKEARGIKLLGADNNLTCSLATADEIYRRFGGLTQAAVFERVDEERQKPKNTRRPALVKPAPPILSAQPAPSTPSIPSAPSSSSAKGTIDAQTSGQSAKPAFTADDLQIVSGRTLGLFELDFLNADVTDYAVFAVEKNEARYKVTLVATGGDATANLCDYALTFQADGDDRA